MHIISLNIGAPQTQTYGGKEVLTAGHKTPVASAMLRFTNFDGDRQADRKNHGGPDKAVCVYSFDHYLFWEATLGEKLEPGAFSENLTIVGLRESEVCLGDTFRVGEALAQISQPRQPCSKLAGKRGSKDLPGLIHENSFSGFYLRVLEEGLVRAGDPFERVSRHPAGVTVTFANQVMYHQRTDPESLQRVLAVAELSAAWRKSLAKKIANS
ncbi:MAG: MOSC domain-containing protein [Chloroflexi bacterium]|nr:MOSC domain-containing protein [Chloroflexota bacterium]